MSTTSTWIEHLVNPKTITSIYTTEPPSLAQVHLSEVSIVCGSDLQCRLHFDLKDFPADAPIKWVQRKCNTVQLSLNLIQIELTQCTIPSGSGIGDLIIIHDGTRFHITFTTQPQGVVFQATATWIHVDNISGYQKEQVSLSAQ
ncbi:Imm50 family immunity protein [Hymenobacter koreensis]|uniref:Imm50 family immunity protein n=1 Tax=Hymenobacter koreensis TaxID=1084523 RepID=UPI003CD0BC7B